MKCTKCGRTIGVEGKICPYCKTENSLARRHEENIGRFEGEFRKTETDVVKSAGSLAGLGIRAVILALLVIGILVMSRVTEYNYRGPDTDEILKKDALAHVEEYTAEMDEYLSRGEYMEFEAFVYSHEIPCTYDEYRKFLSVNYCAASYYECVRYMETIILRSTDPDYWDSLDVDMSGFCRYLDSFNEVIAVQKEREKDSTYHACIEDMEQDLRAMLRTYLHFSEEETDEFMQLSEAKMAVRMEEVLKDEAE
ncbi:MAG: hypothetical protein K6E50_13335 [Lachnospiraceae bacterium]|nr:hypothetical protein [Lachnospiraceae bacterium]